MNTIIGDYYTVFAKSRDELDKEVNIKIKEGYQPHGNAYVVSNPSTIAYHQPMIKFAPNYLAAIAAQHAKQ